MAVIDCFTYFNEVDVLQMRLQELNTTASYFVIVESSQTFTGIDKPFYLDDVSSIDQWRDKIINVRISFPSKNMTPWEREAYQRNAIMHGIKDLVDSEDCIVISDVDEIPRTVSLNRGGTLQLDVDQYFWNLNWKAPRHCNQGARPVTTRIDGLLRSSPHELRASNLPRIPNSGWHFSYLCDIASFHKKLESFSHTEYNTKEFKDAEGIFYRMSNGIDPFDRFPLRYQAIDNTYPICVQKNPSSYAHLIMPAP